jgi:hypothetical protein
MAVEFKVKIVNEVLMSGTDCQICSLFYIKIKNDTILSEIFLRFFVNSFDGDVFISSDFETPPARCFLVWPARPQVKIARTE